MASGLLCTNPTTQIIDTDPVRVGLWMQARGAGFYRPGSTCIALERDGVLIAATMYDFCNGASIYASIAIDGPITRTWLHRIFHYPFVQLGCRIILGMIAGDNRRSQRLTEHFGFQLAASIPDADPSGELLVYALHKDRCRWIRSRNE